MASTSQKLNFSVTDNKVGRDQGAGQVLNVPKKFPVSVVSIDKTNSIITLKFETDGMPYTLPNVTVPLSGPEYIRYPIKPQMMSMGQTQPGDFGYVSSADLNIGNMSGLGPNTPANFTQAANLSPLIFTLMGNKNWTPHDDQTALMGYAPTGTIHRDTNKKSKHVVHPTNGITSQTGAQGQTGPTSNPTYNIIHFLDPKNGHLLKSKDKDNGDHFLSIVPKGGSGTIGWLASVFGGKHTHQIDDSGHNLTSQKKVNVTAPETDINSPQTNILGNTNVSGILSAIGGIFGGGGGGGGISATGAITGSSAAVTGNSAAATLQTTQGYTVAQLNTLYPPAGNKGMRAYVVDANGPAWLNILAGLGTVVCPAFCNGTNWVAG